VKDGACPIKDFDCTQSEKFLRQIYVAQNIPVWLQVVFRGECVRVAGKVLHRPHGVLAVDPARKDRGRMTVQPNKFANQIEFHRYAELNDLAYAWAYTRAFDRWKQLLTPGEYEVVEVRTNQGAIEAMLFPKVTRAEQEMAAAREHWRAIQLKRTMGSP
jgi:hypothetical protein